jgi:predicted RNA-binding protein
VAVEVRRRASDARVKRVEFSELRGDWYRGADLMARLIARSRLDDVELVGFPVAWVPMFLHWDVRWSEPTLPRDYQPLFSDVTAHEIVRVAESARENGRLRSLVEAAAALDPLLADVLHKLDRRADVSSPSEVKIPFSGWQSYGRPEVLDFNRRALAAGKTSKDTVILWPCARRRPYQDSKTHKRLLKGLSEVGVSPAESDHVVVSSLGLIPQSLWSDSVVLSYDSGVPDIYRILRLMRTYFRQNRYRFAVDSLEFEPYRDCLRILRSEGLFERVIEGPSRRIKFLPCP